LIFRQCVAVVVVVNLRACAGFREVLFFWRYPGTSASPSAAVSTKRVLTRNEILRDGPNDGAQSSTRGGRRATKTENICMASMPGNASDRQDSSLKLKHTQSDPV